MEKGKLTKESRQALEQKKKELMNNPILSSCMNFSKVINKSTKIWANKESKHSNKNQNTGKSRLEPKNQNTQNNQNIQNTKNTQIPQNTVNEQYLKQKEFSSINIKDAADETTNNNTLNHFINFKENNTLSNSNLENTFFLPQELPTFDNENEISLLSNFTGFTTFKNFDMQDEFKHKNEIKGGNIMDIDSDYDNEVLHENSYFHDERDVNIQIPEYYHLNNNCLKNQSFGNSTINNNFNSTIDATNANSTINETNTINNNESSITNYNNFNSYNGNNISKDSNSNKKNLFKVNKNQPCASATDITNNLESKFYKRDSILSHSLSNKIDNLHLNSFNLNNSIIQTSELKKKNLLKNKKPFVNVKDRDTVSVSSVNTKLTRLSKYSNNIYKLKASSLLKLVRFYNYDFNSISELFPDTTSEEIEKLFYDKAVNPTNSEKNALMKLVDEHKYSFKEVAKIMKKHDACYWKSLYITIIMDNSSLNKNDIMKKIESSDANKINNSINIWTKDNNTEGSRISKSYKFMCTKSPHIDAPKENITHLNNLDLVEINTDETMTENNQCDVSPLNFKQNNGFDSDNNINNNRNILILNSLETNLTQNKHSNNSNNVSEPKINTENSNTIKVQNKNSPLYERLMSNKTRDDMLNNYNNNMNNEYVPKENILLPQLKQSNNDTNNINSNNLKLDNYFGGFNMENNKDTFLNKNNSSTSFTKSFYSNFLEPNQSSSNNKNDNNIEIEDQLSMMKINNGLIRNNDYNDGKNQTTTQNFNDIKYSHSNFINNNNIDSYNKNNNEVCYENNNNKTEKEEFMTPNSLMYNPNTQNNINIMNLSVVSGSNNTKNFSLSIISEKFNKMTSVFANDYNNKLKNINFSKIGILELAKITRLNSFLNTSYIKIHNFLAEFDHRYNKMLTYISEYPEIKEKTLETDQSISIMIQNLNSKYSKYNYIIIVSLEQIAQVFQLDFNSIMRENTIPNESCFLSSKSVYDNNIKNNSNIDAQSKKNNIKNSNNINTFNVVNEDGFDFNDKNNFISTNNLTEPINNNINDFYGHFGNNDFNLVKDFFTSENKFNIKSEVDGLFDIDMNQSNTNNIINNFNTNKSEIPGDNLFGQSHNMSSTNSFNMINHSSNNNMVDEAFIELNSQTNDNYHTKDPLQTPAHTIYNPCFSSVGKEDLHLNLPKFETDFGVDKKSMKKTPSQKFAISLTKKIEVLSELVHLLKLKLLWLQKLESFC